VRGAVVKKARVSLPGGLEETGRRVGVEEGGSHPSSVSRGSESDGSNASVENGVGPGDA
jgi:hypothetical protein